MSMNFPQKSISVIIVSWNVSELLENCIRSIYQYADDVVHEIIVVDNNSSDDSVHRVRQNFPEIKVICNKINVGFASANNQGLEIARGDYVLFLNPDTILTENALQRMLIDLFNNDKIGLIGPRLIFPNGEIQLSCARLLPSLSKYLLLNTFRLNKFPIIGPYFLKKYLSPYDLQISQFVQAISGAAMLTRTKIVKEIGGFRNGYIYTGEDTDLCYKMSKKGYLIKYCAESFIIHYAGQSAKTAKVKTSINSAISVEYYFKNTGSPSKAIIYRFIVKYIDTPISLIISLIKFLLRKSKITDFREQILISKGIWAWKKVS